MTVCGDPTLVLLHEAFKTFNEALGQETAESKAQLVGLQAQLQAKGIHGQAALSLVTSHRLQIAWESMVPELFHNFYRFIFFLCREPAKRNLQTHLALEAWRLLLRGRFRLLERWCNFVEGSPLAVVTEDTWRQVLDFSRNVHEDLGNYDPSGAWAVMLDEFVEHLRSSNGLRGQTDDGGGPSTSSMDTATPCAVRPMNPHCGSKRRGPDVDLVAEQLGAMPALGDSRALPESIAHLTPKRLCMSEGIGGSSPHVGVAVGGQPVQLQGVGECSGVHHRQLSDQEMQPSSDVLASLHSAHVRRSHLKIRRSGVSEMVKQSVCEALGFS